ncbi:SRPBCC family protein [uncultured Marivita sp.]|uniref:SRPBCC family protein n=1 Tax=uncultured Marivita sp. TaxID=888080 RepID=UPI00262AB75F|nr:SRPBCC family protein [uncultured Marivita sp.]
MQTDNTTEIAAGTDRDFSFTVPTSMPDRIWYLWTTPSTWGRWDTGLRSVSMDGVMKLGSTGRIQPLTGPKTRFTVVLFHPDTSYAFETMLPLARLKVERFFNSDRTAFTHRVSFHGVAAVPFARLFGPAFRKALPPTMRNLNALAAET